MGRGRRRRAVALWVGLGLCSLLLQTPFGRAQEAGGGPGVKVAEVSVRGNVRVEREAVLVHVQTKPGSPLDLKALDQDLKSVYAMGFFSQVEVDVTRREQGAVVTFIVKERPLVREVQISGNKKISKEDLETALKVRPQTILDMEKLIAGLSAAKKLYEEKGYLDAAIEWESEEVGANEVMLKYKVDEKKLVRIKKIEFEGNRAFSDRRLRKVMATKQEWLLSRFTGAGVLNKEVLDTDVERIAAFYHEHGYIMVKVDEPKIERKKKGLYLTIKVEEGDQYEIGEIDFRGDLVADRTTLLEGLELKPDEVFRRSQVRRDILTLTDRYGDLGYAFVNVEPQTEVDPSAKTVDITYRIDKGPRVKIGRINITGNTKTRDKVIRRELKIEEQQRFSGTKLRKSRDALNRLGFFQDVKVTTQRGAREDRLDLQVDVVEGRTGSLSAGAGFSSADNLLFNARIAENNLFGRGQRVSLNADFGTIRQNFLASFTEPYLFERPLATTLSAFNWRLEFDDFTRGGTGGRVRMVYPVEALGYSRLLGRYPLEEVMVGMEYRLEDADISDISRRSPPSLFREAGRNLTSSVRPSLTRNTLNSFFDPTRGSMQELGLEYAGLGGDLTFYKIEATGRWYFPLYRSRALGTFVYSFGAAFGLGQGDRGDNGNELPLTERYFPGGIGTVRGFTPRTLGPREDVRDPQGRVIDTDPVGGSRQLVFNNEVIFPLVEQVGLKGVVFLDAGNAFSDAQGFDMTEMRLAVGWGLRWLSPFGPIRIELGYPLNAKRDDKKSTVLFSVGAPF